MTKKAFVIALTVSILFLISAYVGYSNFAFGGRCSDSDIENHPTKIQTWEDNFPIDPPRISYSSLYQMQNSKSYFLKLLVRKDGSAKCYRLYERERGNYGNSAPELNDQIPALKLIVKDLWKWRYPNEPSKPRKQSEIIEVDIWRELEITPIIPLPPNARKNMELLFFRSGCYGFCPSFRVKIMASGQVEFEGREYVRQIGKKALALDSEKVAELFDYFENNQLWSLDGEYGVGPADAGIAGLQTVINGKEQWITHPDWARGYVPYPVVKLEHMIESIPQINELVGPRSEFSESE